VEQPVHQIRRPVRVELRPRHGIPKITDGR
jgi:hypothetical protein